jgi:hypothetical protein
MTSVPADTGSRSDTEFWPPSDLARGLVEDRPFGDSAYILERMERAFSGRLEIVAELTPVAGHLADALNEVDAIARYRVLGDPTVRFVIQQLMAHLRAPESASVAQSECAAVLDSALAGLAQCAGAAVGPLVHQSGTSERLGPNSIHGWVWNGGSLEGEPVVRAFGQLTDRAGHKLCSPNPDHVEVLRAATQLIERISPALAANSLPHTQLVALFEPEGRDRGVMASSQFDILGTIFLSTNHLDNPWVVAEQLLHESLHQKSSDLRHAHSVFVADFDPDLPRSNEGVLSLWNHPGVSGSNLWGPSRAVAALHVYTHLAVYAALAESARQHHRLPSGWDDPRVTTAETARLRALYLCAEIERHHRQALGPAGIAWVDWMRQCLELIRARPHESRLRSALYLQRYRRETIMLGRRFSRLRDVDETTAVDIERLLADEVAMTREILASYSSFSLSDLDRALQAHAVASSQRPFVERIPIVRGLLSESLESVMAEGQPEDANRFEPSSVELMVEKSSRKVVEVLDKLQPSPVGT